MALGGGCTDVLTVRSCWILIQHSGVLSQAHSASIDAGQILSGVDACAVMPGDSLRVVSQPCYKDQLAVLRYGVAPVVSCQRFDFEAAPVEQMHRFVPERESRGPG